QRFVGRDRLDFIQLMASLNLSNPKKIAEAVPANQNCGQLKN
ncbi:MAG: MBL fold metallo-hydrolase, partial [Okeania sp. SIO3B5]|nr:MBL fold metallo-hydrolase [Okeania sp. SIO3B5]